MGSFTGTAFTSTCLLPDLLYLNTIFQIWIWPKQVSEFTSICSVSEFDPMCSTGFAQKVSLVSVKRSPMEEAGVHCSGGQGHIDARYPSLFHLVIWQHLKFHMPTEFSWNCQSQYPWLLSLAEYLVPFLFLIIENTGTVQAVPSNFILLAVSAPTVDLFLSAINSPLFLAA